jgi:peptide/nickel transport system permease protein
LTQPINNEASNAPRPNRPGGGLRSSVADYARTAKGVLFSSMFRYIVRRVIWGILMLLVVSALTFVIFYLLPAGDPAAIRAGRYATPARIAQIRHQLGLDRPVYYQYWVYMKALVVHFDFGTSFKTNLPVGGEIFRRLPVTFSVAIGAVIIWVAIGIPVGIISAIKRRSWLDRVTMGGSLVAISAPVYWLGLIALFLFSKDVGVIKVFGGSGSYVPFFQDPAAWFSSLILPWFVLAAAFTAFYARMVRGNLIETMNEDFIRTARAKGLSERRVVFRHGLRAALTPVVTMAGLDIGTLLGGAVLTETVFNIPGIGRLAYDSIIGSDLPMIQGTVLFGAFFIISANLIVDVLYAFLDPRVRY